MSLRERYNDLLKSVQQLGNAFEQLEPDASRLEEFYLRCVEQCGALGRDLTSGPIGGLALPAQVEQIKLAIEGVDTFNEKQAALVDVRRHMLEGLIERLNNSRYYHRHSGLCAVGEETRAQAMACLAIAKEDVTLCQRICNGIDTQVDLYAEWQSLSEDQHSQECADWPPELLPLVDLRFLIGDLKAVSSKEPAAAETNVLPSEENTNSMLAGSSSPEGDSLSSDADLRVSTEPRPSDRDGSLAERDRAQKRKALQRGLRRNLVPEDHDLSPLLQLDKPLPSQHSPADVDAPDVKEVSVAPSNTDLANRAAEPDMPTTRDAVGESTEALPIPASSAVTSSPNAETQVSHEKPGASKDDSGLVHAAPDSLSRSDRDLDASVRSDTEHHQSREDLTTLDVAATGAEKALVDKAYSAVWAALDQERYSLAYCLLKALESSNLTEAQGLPPALASVVLLSSITTATSTAINGQLRRDFAQLTEMLDSMQESYRLPVQLLTMSSALKPALVAPFTDAGTSLMSNQIPAFSMRSFIELCRAVSTFSQQHVQVDPSILTGVCAHADWQTQMLQLKAQLRDWWQSERCAKVIYAHTTNVWQNWLQESGKVGAFLSDVTSDAFDSDDRLGEFLVEWGDDREIDKRCKITDTDLRGTGARRRPIDGRALHALRQKVSMLRDLLSAIRQKLAARPDSESNSTYELVKQCRERVLQELDPALKELQTLQSNSSQDTAVRLSAKLAIQSLGSLRSLFTEPKLLQPPTEQVSDLLLSDLVLAPGVDYSLEEERAFTSEELVKLIQAALNPLSEQEAFDLQTNQKNHAATERIIQKLTRRNESSEFLSELTNKRLEALERDRIKIKADIEATQQEIDKSVCFDLVNEADRLRLTAEVESMRTLLDEEANFSPTVAGLRKIKSELATLRDSRLREVRARLEHLDKNSVRPQDLEAIQRTLDGGDFPTADEYISLVRDGELLDLKNTEEFDEFNEFFRAFLPETTRYLKENTAEQPSFWVRQLE